MKKKILVVDDDSNIAELLRFYLEKEDLSMEERNKYHAVIEENAEKLNSLVSNVLKLNKLENQVIVKECEVFDFIYLLICKDYIFTIGNTVNIE